MVNQVVHMVTTVLYVVIPQDKDEVKVAAKDEELECLLLFS